MYTARRWLFSQDKGKYEVIVGQQKAAEDLAEFWFDILNRYPSVIALIDPMRKYVSCPHPLWIITV